MKYVLNIPLLSLVRCGFGLAGILLLAACATTAPGGGSAQTDQGAGKYAATGTQLENPDALRVGELILIEYSGVGDPPPKHEERIKTDGKVTLPNIGSVQAAGKTRGELEAEIHRLYVPAYYQRLAVVVRNEGRFFYVKGQVRSPNRYQYLTEMTVTKAIAAAGDFTDFANKKKVLVTRADGRKFKVNCLEATQDHKLDLPIFPDDTIEVPRRYF